MPAHIIGIRGLHDGKLVMLGDAPMTFGRTPDNTLPIDDQLTSRRHAEIRREPRGYVLYDLGSSNGTLVNGQRIQSHPLTPGDQFEIGTALFRFDETADVAGLGKTVMSPPVFDDENEMTSRSSPFAFELVASRGPLAGQRFPLGLDAVSLGRTPDNIVQLQSPRASRKHCEIRPQSGQLILVDLNSSNGTYVNGQKVPTAVLQPGDEVSIGEEGYVVVRAGEEPVARAAPPPAAPPGPPPPQLFGAPPAAPPVAVPAPLFGAPPPAAAFVAPPPLAPLPVPSFLGVTTPPQRFGGPPPIGVASAPGGSIGVEDKTEPPPSMPGFTPPFNPPQQSPTGFAPVKAGPPGPPPGPANFGAPPGPPPANFGAPPGPPPAPGGFAPVAPPPGNFGAPPGPPPGPANFGAPPGPPPGNFGAPPGPPPGPGGFAPVGPPPGQSGFGPPPGQSGFGPPPARPSGGFAPVGPPPAAKPEAPAMVNCPMCQRAVDARYTHCPYDATPLPGKPAW